MLNQIMQNPLSILSPVTQTLPAQIQESVSTSTDGGGSLKKQLEVILQAINDFFNPDLSGYKNFNLGSDSIINTKVIIYGVFAGVLLATIYGIYNKKVIGRLVRRLLGREILSPDKALTLDEIGLGRNIFIKLALRSYTLRRVVSSVEEDEYIKELRASMEAHEAAVKEAKENKRSIPRYVQPKFKPQVSKLHYYIDESKKYTAEMRYNDRGSGIGSFFFVLLISVICIVIIFALLPTILRVIDNSIGQFTAGGMIL